MSSGKKLQVNAEKFEKWLSVDSVNQETSVKAILLPKEITDGSKYQFWKDCIVFLTQLILKLQEIIWLPNALHHYRLSIWYKTNRNLQLSSVLWLKNCFSLTICYLPLRIPQKSNLRNFYYLLMNLPRITICNFSFPSQELINSWELILKIKQLYGSYVSLFSHSHIPMCSRVGI